MDFSLFRLFSGISFWEIFNLVKKLTHFRFWLRIFIKGWRNAFQDLCILENENHFSEMKIYSNYALLGTKLRWCVVLPRQTSFLIIFITKMPIRSLKLSKDSFSNRLTFKIKPLLNKQNFSLVTFLKRKPTELYTS